MSKDNLGARLQDAPVPIRLKLSLLWASLTLCYLYCDYFELYQPGKLQSMLAGQMGPLGSVTQGVLLGVSILLSLPAVMVFLSVALPARLSQIVNVILGLVFTAIMLLLLPQVWLYYKYFAVVEIALSCSVVWLAWKWPQSESVAHSGLLADSREV